MNSRNAMAVGLGMVIMMTISATCGAQEPAAGWQAGVARVDVTPQEPMWLAGYGARDRESEGTLHPIWVKALALKDATGHRAVLVTSDLLGFPKGMSDTIRDRLQEKFQLSRADIILNSSHTHSGPVLRHSLYAVYPLDEAGIKKVEQYSLTLEDQVVACVEKALAGLAPAKLSSANGVTRFAVNRRTNREAEILDTHDFKGPVDHAVPVLKVAREDGSLLAVAFGYACHATTLDFYKLSGDYPGFAQLEFEAAHPGATALFFAGCGADQNPMPRRTVALAQQYGRELAAAVDRVLTDPMKSLAPSLKTDYKEIDLAFSAVPTREALTAIAEKGSIYDKRAAQHFLQILDQGKPLPTSYPSYPIQLWILGEQALVALGGEVVSDYAIMLKHMLGRDLFVMGYSNDVMAYISSLRVLREGGYEGGSAQMLYGLPAPWTEDIESRILSTARDLATRSGIAVMSAELPQSTAPKL